VEKSLKILCDLLSLMVSNLLQTSSFIINSNQKKLNQKRKKKKKLSAQLGPLRPNHGGGVKISPPQLPTPIHSSCALQKRLPSLDRLPRAAVRPPASPNRRLSAVYRSDGAVSWPAAGSNRAPPRTSGLPPRTRGKLRLGRGKPPRRRDVPLPFIYLVSKYVLI
jgi:hypothetical protein